MRGPSEFIADQLRSPSGPFGRIVLSRFFKRSSAALNGLTLASLALEPEDRVLEVGFGSGDLMARVVPVVSEGFVAGVDFSPDMVDVCAKRFAPLLTEGRVELRCGDADALPYEDDRFTKACAVNTIYFWPDAAVPLSELHRVLAAGGRVALGFGTPAALRRLPFVKYGFTLYEPEHVRTLMEDAGFGDIAVSSGSGRAGEFVCLVGTKSPAVRDSDGAPG